MLSGIDPATQVPSCPDWTAADLAWHLTEVQWFWGTIVGENLMDPEGIDERRPARPDSLGATLDLFDDVSARLVAALSGTDPDAPRWTWYPSDQTAGFTRRRQAHESLIHRVDAEMTAGSSTPVDAELATDGIDEILRVMIGGIPEWGSFEPDGTALALSAHEGAGWAVAFGRFTGTSPTTGTTYDEDVATVRIGATDANTSIFAPAADLDLWLWGRADVSELSVEGDHKAVNRLRALAVESTQ